MPLLLLVPLLIAGVFVLWALLLPLSVLQRDRLGKARRRVQPWFVRANAWLLAVSALAFLGSAWLADQWIDDALVDALLGLVLGGLTGGVGLAIDRVEATPQGLFRTPNRWLVLGLSLLVAGRLAVGLWWAWSDAPSSGLAAWVTRGGLIGVGGVLLGYAVATGWGLQFRVAGKLRSGR